MSNILNINNLPQEVQKVFAPFAQRLVEEHGDNIVSIYIYGSATGQNFVPKHSDINSALVLKRITREDLDKSLRTIAAVRRKRIVAPLIMTLEHINSSLDVFPIEFLDMQENYAVVYGKDVLKDLKVEMEHVRLFCEQQIKGKLIRIREAYLEVGLKKKGIERLLNESLDSLIPVFRSVLRLKGVEAGKDKPAILKATAECFGLDSEVMLAIWQDKKNDDRINGQDVREFFAKYIQQIEKIAQGVDQL